MTVLVREVVPVRGSVRRRTQLVQARGFDLAETRRAMHGSGLVGISELAERAGEVRALAAERRRDRLARSPEPGVFVDRRPDDGHEPAVRLENALQLSQRRERVVGRHQRQAARDGVERVVRERQRLVEVGLEEPKRAGRLVGASASLLEPCATGVDAGHLDSRSCERHREAPAAAAGVEHPLRAGDCGDDLGGAEGQIVSGMRWSVFGGFAHAPTLRSIPGRMDTLGEMSDVPYRRTFVRLLGFLRPYKASLAVSTILAVLSQVAAIAIVVLIGETIDGIDERRGTETLAWTVAAIFVVGIAKAALMAGRRLISGWQALGIEKDMREGLYGRLLGLSFGFYDRHQTGQLMSRATVDLQSVRFFLGFGLIFFFQHAITVLSVTIVLLFVEWHLALIALAITPVIVVVAYRYSHVSHPVLRDVQQRLGEVATVAEESIVGVHVVKAFAQEERRQAAFDRASDGVFAATVRAFRQRALYVPLLSFLPLLAQAAVLLVAGRMVVSGSLTLGQFFLFNLLLAMLVVPLRSLGMWIGQAQRATAAGERIFEVLDEPEGVDDRPGAQSLPAGPGAIRFEHVSFGYTPDRPVLEEIDLEVAAGTTVALIGHTGSGKTTLAALVPRFYDATDGRILVDGVDIRDVTRRSLRREIGVISQDPFLFSATVRENIAFGVLDASAEQVEAAARAAQAHEFIEALPQGYETVIGERGITLSGGQRQRLAIARALVIDPRILILDDATASVDATTEARIRAGLAEAMLDRTTIIIAHRLSTISLADEVVVLEQGRITTRGTESELLATSAVYRELHAHGLIDGLLEETA